MEESRSSQLSNVDEEEECEEIIREGNIGGSSSISNNSIVDEENNNNNNEKKIRPYVRSKLPRLRWTPDLHLRFLHAVQRLGGQERATPKLVLQMMNIKGLSIAHVKSHLQMFRSKKQPVDDPNQVLIHHRNLFETGDKNIYNLSQIPMLRGYNPSQISSSYSYGFGDASFSAYEKMNMHRPFNWTNNIFRVGSSIFGEQSTNYYYQKDELLSFRANESLCTRTRLSHVDLTPSMPINSTTTNPPELLKSLLKRKASDTSSLDLDLSLKLNSNVDDEETLEEDRNNNVDSNLSLSLYSHQPSSNNNVSKRMKEAEDHCNKERGKIMASTLDLTI